jgi:hypothetical protein
VEAVLPHCVPAVAASRRLPILVIVALTCASAVIHATAVPEHLREWGPAGAFFILAAATQLTWAGLVWRTPTARLLRAGMYGNAVLVAIWLMSRTVGIPVGPHAGEAEAIGTLDALATVDELFGMTVVAFLLAGRALRARLVAGGASLAVAASVLAALGPGAQGSSHGEPRPHAHPGHDSSHSHGLRER